MSVGQGHVFPGVRDERDKPAVSVLARDHERSVAGVPQEGIALSDTKIPEPALGSVVGLTLLLKERINISPEDEWLVTLTVGWWSRLRRCPQNGIRREEAQ